MRTVNPLHHHPSPALFWLEAQVGGAEIHVAVNTGEERRGKHWVPTISTGGNISPAGSFQFQIKNSDISLLLESSYNTILSVFSYLTYIVQLFLSPIINYSRLAEKHRAHFNKQFVECFYLWKTHETSEVKSSVSVL